MSEEWGPWIEHDGRGCPLKVGTPYQGVDVNSLGEEEVFEAAACIRGGFSWDWQWSEKMIPGHNMFATRIIRYRIRKPKGLTILEGILADLPAPVSPPRVDA